MANKTWIATGATGDLNVAGNYSPSGIPVALDNLRFPPGTAPITASFTRLNNATLVGALGIVIFEKGYSGAIGDTSNYMQFSASRFEFWGTGRSYIDLEASNITGRVFETEAPDTGKRGLYVLGTNLSVLEVFEGFVGLATHRDTEVSTVATVRVMGSGADIWLAKGCTLTTVDVLNGLARIRAGLTTLNVKAGEARSEEAGAFTTVNVRGGLFVPNSIGAITTLNLYDGEVDTFQSGAARTITTLNVEEQGIFRWNKDAVTLTNRPDFKQNVIINARRAAA